MNVYLEVLESLKKVFGERGFRILESKSKKFIILRGNKNDISTFIHIRIDESRKNVTIDSMLLDKSIQRKGYFTLLVKTILDTKGVKTLKISQVVTNEMKNACKKLGMAQDNTIAGYSLTAHNNNKN